MATFRPLQPAPMDQEQAPQPQSRPLLTQKPKRTVTLGACIACRKRKSKCDGSRPVCTCCAQKDTECIYELGPNEKPSQAMKRKNEEMQGELSNLRQLYDFLRLRPEQEAQEILRRIRNNPSETTPTQRIQELADFVRHGDLLIQPSFRPPTQHFSSSANSVTLPPLRLALDSPSSDPRAYSQSLPYPNIMSMGHDGPSPQRRRHASDADVSASSDSPPSQSRPSPIEAILHKPRPPNPHSLSDQRLASVRKWTTVVHDDNLLCILMSAWHSWEYKYHHFLDWDNLLDDMSTGQTNFCSSLLINAILASGSFQSPLVRDRSKPFGDNVATLFYKEARRLWELEEGQDSLPRLQAALCLYMVLGKHGRDKVGHTFLVEACRIARDLGLFRVSSSSSQRPRRVPQDKWEKTRAVTAWALFNFQLSMSLTYSFAPIIKSQPPLQIPYDDETEALFRYECSRHIVLSDCADTLMDQDGTRSDIPPKPEQIEVLYLRLKSWWESRPDRLDPTKHPSPENLLAAMQYNVAITRLFQPFLDAGSSLERVKQYHHRARSMFATSIKELRRLMALHEATRGWSNTLPYVLHAITVTGFGSLDEVALENRSRFIPENSEAYQGLLTCLNALGTMANFVFYAQPLFRLLTQACETLDIWLPLDVTTFMDRYRTAEWTKKAASVVSSQYMADIRMPATDSEGQRMDKIISGWDEKMTLAANAYANGIGNTKSEADCKVYDGL
ncbi:hypothetical protein K504DRAFT_177266 [Pleomassaria siparia CBS 279.74]|uniref:Zn(2)-C6 fungal-type domain-containing protein n=1 Tax=Pleomassaria siparia CBS 279.74 TaxID=1314801 RepID=A0A6G1JSY5_9PLEO|nr:hypothetical protein K504DRAFT_177266 [Pleomassaria siparia CBS 279.74]